MQTTTRTTTNGASQLKRLAKAAKIVQSGKMIQVGSNWVITSETGHTHAVNGVCDCADYQFNTKLCKHRLAAKLAEKLAQGKRTFSELLTVGVRNIVKDNPASVRSANGVNEILQIASNSTTEITDEQRAAAFRRLDINNPPAGVCKSCEQRMNTATIASDGLCWRCAQERDYADDQAEYSALAHGLA